MLIAIFGENCSGKSTLADQIGKAAGAEIVSGKDYLRMAKSESEAELLFRKKLEGAVTGENLVYVISEPQQIRFLPDGAVRILVQADLETIRERFRARMHGNLPEPVARMLEAKHGIFDKEKADYRYDGVKGDAALLCAELLRRGSF
jgi:adenylate kinase family enzyme